jgi:hypothetical protein
MKRQFNRALVFAALLSPICALAFQKPPESKKTDATPMDFQCEVVGSGAEPASWIFRGRVIHARLNTLTTELLRSSGGWSSNEKSLGTEEMRVEFEKVGDDCRMKVTQVDDKDQNHLLILLPIPSSFDDDAYSPAKISMTLNGQGLDLDIFGKKVKTKSNCILTAELRDHARKCTNLDGSVAESSVAQTRSKSNMPQNDTVFNAKKRTQGAPGTPKLEDDAI